jgi:hypothetical protein
MIGRADPAKLVPRDHHLLRRRGGVLVAGDAVEREDDRLADAAVFRVPGEVHDAGRVECAGGDLALDDEVPPETGQPCSAESLIQVESNSPSPKPDRLLRHRPRQGRSIGAAGVHDF